MEERLISTAVRCLQELVPPQPLRVHGKNGHFLHVADEIQLTQRLWGETKTPESVCLSPSPTKETSPLGCGCPHLNR